MTLKRRHFLIFLGASLSTIACGKSPQSSSSNPSPSQGASSSAKPDVGFEPVQGPMPLPTDGLTAVKQVDRLSSYEVMDDLVLPEGFT